MNPDDTPNNTPDTSPSQRMQVAFMMQNVAALYLARWAESLALVADPGDREALMAQYMRLSRQAPAMANMSDRAFAALWSRTILNSLSSSS